MRTRSIPCYLKLLAGLGVVALSLSLLNRQPAMPDVSYQNALATTAGASERWFARATDERETEVLSLFRSLWSDLTAARVRSLLPDVYAENVWFNDTVKTITNRNDLVDYMVATADHLQSCRVVVVDIASTPEGYYVRWEMDVVTPNAKPGEVWSSIGMSHLRINEEGQIILHQDYWDAAGGIYEKLPLIGWLLRNIRARL